MAFVESGWVKTEDAEYYQEPAERMAAGHHQTMLELRQEVHELRLAIIELGRQLRNQEDDGR